MTPKPSLLTRIPALLSLCLALGVAQADDKGMLTLGAQYDGWQATNTVQPYNGTEILVPFSISYAPDAHWNLYGQTSFAVGSYTDSLSGTPETLNLSALTATSLGTQLYFDAFGIPAMLELDITAPTGDPSWESKEIPSSVPGLFIGSRYQDEGWSVGGLFGLSFPSVNNQIKYGLALGYTYEGPYDPNYGSLAGIQFKTGDVVFLGLNRTENFSGGQSNALRVTAMAFGPTQEGGLTSFQVGPNISASFSYNDPKGFSWTLGGTVSTLSSRNYLTPFQTAAYGLEPFLSSGSQVFATPSYTLDNLTLAATAKFVTANGYSLWDASGLYNGGGWLFGFDPSYMLSLDKGSALNLTAGADYIIAHNAAYDSSAGQPIDLKYVFWSFLANYEIKL